MVNCKSILQGKNANIYAIGCKNIAFIKNVIAGEIINLFLLILWYFTVYNCNFIGAIKPIAWSLYTTFAMGICLLFNFANVFLLQSIISIKNYFLKFIYKKVAYFK